MNNEAKELSTMINIEGITLTPDCIATMKQWQEGNITSDLNTLDDAIGFIVSSYPDDVGKAFDLIYRIMQLKNYLKTINPKE